MIALLVIGADERELRGAGIAAALAAAVLIVPLLLALVGHDDYIARGVMPAWIPLAIVIAAACTTRGAPIAGAALAIALLALFVYAGVKIDSDRQFQKSDWRGIASALGRAGSTRAIVAYDGEFATGPLSIYLHGVPWSGPGMAPAVRRAGQRLGAGHRRRLRTATAIAAAARHEAYLVEAGRRLPGDPARSRLARAAHPGGARRPRDATAGRGRGATIGDHPAPVRISLRP